LDERGRHGVHEHRFPLEGTCACIQIRIAPKRNIFKQLSLDTDLEELNKVISPREANIPKPPIDSLNQDRTRRFVVEIIAKYEN
jgi:hypothetical protein